jgi:hypothetical protein
VGLVLSFIAAVMQFWILDVDRYFHSPLVYGGWLLSILSVFVFTAGLILSGFAIQRTNALPRARSLILIVGSSICPPPFSRDRTLSSTLMALSLGSCSMAAFRSPWTYVGCGWATSFSPPPAARRQRYLIRRGRLNRLPCCNPRAEATPPNNSMEPTRPARVSHFMRY